MSCIPPWAAVIDADVWPTVLVSDDALGYWVPVPAPWAHEPEIEQLPTETVHTYPGRFAGEWLSIRRLEDADAFADLSDWVGAYLSLIRFPVPPPAAEPPELVEWSELQPCTEVATRVGVDDVRLGQGVATGTSDTGPSWFRLYVLLARAADHAWNVNLSILSACPPNAPEPLVRANDHVRAAAVFGRLGLSYGVVA